MVDIMTPEQRSALMSRIRSVDTKPELFVRRALHAMGYRFRTHVRDLPGRPDLVFTKRHAVVFVHGCFWHRHGCKKTYVPKVAKFLPRNSKQLDRTNETDTINEQAGECWLSGVKWRMTYCVRP